MDKTRYEVIMTGVDKFSPAVRAVREARRLMNDDASVARASNIVHALVNQGYETASVGFTADEKAAEAAVEALAAAGVSAHYEIVPSDEQEHPSEATEPETGATTLDPPYDVSRTVLFVMGLTSGNPSASLAVVKGLRRFTDDPMYDECAEVLLDVFPPNQGG